MPVFYIFISKAPLLRFSFFVPLESRPLLRNCPLLLHKAMQCTPIHLVLGSLAFPKWIRISERGRKYKDSLNIFASFLLHYVERTNFFRWPDSLSHITLLCRYTAISLPPESKCPPLQNMGPRTFVVFCWLTNWPRSSRNRPNVPICRLYAQPLHPCKTSTSLWFSLFSSLFSNHLLAKISISGEIEKDSKQLRSVCVYFIKFHDWL